ncbi:MAG: hypothetical protein KF773_41785 [Deltaproteobacteria bacterium]|nr:hypothetical protein [Deltaproteobacteria bacterium]
MRSYPAILVAALAAAQPSAARADRLLVPPKARAFADAGRHAHERGDYTAAIAAFKEAYVIAPAPALLFNLAQAYRLRGDCDDAALMYRRYLASAPPADEAALAAAHLATVEKCTSGHLAMRTPPPRAATAVASVHAAPARPAHSHLRELGIGIAAVGAASLGVAIYEAGVAYQASSDVERAYAKGGHGRAIAERDAEGREAATMARIFGVAGVAAVAGGAALYVLGKRAERVPVVAPIPGGGARVAVAWRF